MCIDWCDYGKVICVECLCCVPYVVRWYNVVDIIAMYGGMVCCSVVCRTLVDVWVFSIMCSELLIMSEFS